MRILKYLTAREWAYLLCGTVFVIGQVWLDLLLPDYMARITLLVQTPGSSADQVLSTGVIMLLCALGSFLFSCIAAFFAARIAAGLARSVRKEVFYNTVDFSLEEIGRFSTASLITRCTNDITQIQLFVAIGFQMLIKAPIMAVWAIVKIADKSWEWTLATGIIVVILLSVLCITMALVIPRFVKVQGFTDDLNRITRENLSGIRVVRAYNAEGYQHKKFQKANNDLTAVNLFANSVLAIQMPGMRLLMSGLALAIYWIGIYLIQAAEFAAKPVLFADMVAYSSYAMIVITAFMMLAMTFIMTPRALVAMGRVLEVIDTDIAVKDGAIDAASLSKRGEIKFEHVDFAYPGGGDCVLHDISFTANPGEVVALIGSTGAGKTTLLNLIPRFYDVTAGRVLLDGVDVRLLTLRSLREKLAYVSQKAIMFAGSVASNVAYGLDRSDEAMLAEALRIAQARDFVDALPQGFFAHVAQAGVNFSGGQRQRLSIARAVYKRPEIYLFDDSFSALDYRTDHALRSELKKQAQGSTVLIVAQRIGTVLDADNILVLDEGHIVGQGTHEQLLQSCAVYQEIAASQLSEQELSRSVQAQASGKVYSALQRQVAKQAMQDVSAWPDPDPSISESAQQTLLESKREACEERREDA